MSDKETPEKKSVVTKIYRYIYTRVYAQVYFHIRSFPKKFFFRISELR